MNNTENKPEHYKEETYHQYLDEELDLSTRQTFEAHLTQCESCTQQLASIHTLFTQVSSLPQQELQLDLAERVLINIQTRPVPIPKSFQRFSCIQVAAAVFMLFLSLPYIGQIDIPEIEIQLPQVSPEIPTFDLTLILTDFQTSITAFEIPPLLELIPNFTFPELYPTGLSSFLAVSLVLSAAILWWFGNRIFLTNYPINGG